MIRSLADVTDSLKLKRLISCLAQTSWFKRDMNHMEEVLNCTAVSPGTFNCIWTLLRASETQSDVYRAEGL